MIFLCLILVFAHGCYGTDDVSTNETNGFSCELLLTRMGSLENKFLELQVEIKKQMRENERTILKQMRGILMEQKGFANHEALNEEHSVASEVILTIKSCESEIVERSGIYLLSLKNSTEFQIYCEQDMHGGGWIVIQNRFDGSVEFNRNWTEYKNGFGNLNGEFWLGLDKINMLTSNKTMQLLIHLEDFFGHKKFAVYSEFAIGTENEKYPLKVIKGEAGNLDHSSFNLNGSKFSTFDADNDRSYVHCAAMRRAGWWYNSCSYSNLNGPYIDEEDPVSMNWFGFSKKYLGLKISKMMIK